MPPLMRKRSNIPKKNKDSQKMAEDFTRLKLLLKWLEKTLIRMKARDCAARRKGSWNALVSKWLIKTKLSSSQSAEFSI